MKKKIIILGASLLQIPAIKKAKEMGLHVISIDMDENAAGFKYADESYTISTNDVEEVLRISRKIKPDAIITIASDKPMITVARVGKELGLNTISESTSIKVTNKARMRECLEYNKIPIPRFKVINNKDSYLEYTDQMSEMFIVKPADNSGSRGIFLVKDRCEAIDAYNYSSKYSSTGEILVEEYIEGAEVSVESLTLNGRTEIISITDKSTTGAPYFVELGHSIPSILDEKTQLQIKEITIGAIKALGINIGPAHTEIKITKDGPKIIEVGARLGGDNITTDLVPLSTGINMVECCIKLALGHEIEINEKKDNGSAIRYFESEPGILKNIENLDDVITQPGVVDIVFTKKIGDNITEVKSSSDRIGYVICQADTSTEAINLCEKVKKEINIKIN
ncbi:ATP-grasp domain-containing protein [Paraclostridium dentum]|uniref:ATP-grasp domain-containing protein n=1 Tax=Paraclostridium dentum TaxID=2662455 RepID=UPI0019811B97|nr:ATP-grasp domain-containing protein [Paraclostridium dentum]